MIDLTKIYVVEQEEKQNTLEIIN